jgi:feruloyl esterase
MTLLMPIYPYPQRTGWDAKARIFEPMDGPRGGVERIAERFRPAAAGE